jgi:hypothetical protein
MVSLSAQPAPPTDPEVTMDVRQARTALPTGTDRVITFTGASGKSMELHVTVIEHDTDAVYVGAHPAMICVPYASLVSARKVSA